MYVSTRARKMEPSATLAVTAKAKSLKREGKPVISFGAGEPDFNSPSSALRYAEEAMKKGQTHYTPGTGIPELREAVCAYYKEHFGLEYKPADVVVGAGAKPLLYEALGCLLDPGDEVLVFTPAWVSYVEQIRFLGGVPVVVDTG
nr:aminotransferase class I/II-fold pyridoxal phosphate-dependent enzyme [Synergistaceae bacterium]